jgi:hypothetical protein
MVGFGTYTGGTLSGVLAAVLIAACPVHAQAWDMAHADGANTGFVNVTTQPATAGSVSIPYIGTFARGVGPVIDDDGTVYIGNEQGQFMAFRADGQRAWTYNLTGEQKILASAAINTQGTIFVVGVGHDGLTLHSFNRSGDLNISLPIPNYGTGSKSTAAPTIMSVGNNDLVLVPFTYKMANNPVRFSRVAVYTGLLTMLDFEVNSFVPNTVGSGATISGDYDPELQPMAAVFQKPERPFPGVLITHGNQVVTHKVDPNVGLVKEVSAGRTSSAFLPSLTTPVILPNDTYVMGRAEGLYGEGIATLNRRNKLDGVRSYDAPTLLPNGTIIAIYKNQMNFVKDFQLVKRAASLPGNSFTSAAASRTHFYVASADAFGSYDVNTLLRVGKFDWVGGGLNPPAIGPKGHVYAIASNILFIFPPPKPPSDYAIIPTQPIVELQGGSAPNVAPQPTSTQPTSTLPPTQLYDPPLTANGNRLFACEELDQDDCGKGDHKDISFAWCQAQGYAKVTGYDVDSRKVKAETLDGRFCAKNKCKVFESIDCEM